MTRPETDHARLTRQCLAALGSLDCELSRREKKVLKVMVENSFGLGLDAAMFGSSQQIAVVADVDEGDVSNALSSLRRMRLVLTERAAPLHPFRKPMLYRVMPQALLHVAAERPANAVVAHARAETSKWLAHANRCYPLQPDLLPPDPRLLDLALAEISRASALADDPLQNGEPKPGAHGATGAAFSPEQTGRPGPAPVPGPDPARPDGGPFLVGESPTRDGPSWRISNYSCARDQISDGPDTDGENISPSGNPDGGMQGGLVGEFPTGDGEAATPADAARADLVRQAQWLLEEFGEPWTPPTRAQEVFDELARCMGAAMGNYGGWWWRWCDDPATRRDVVEAIATWKLSRTHPKHKPWGGGVWKNEFHRRQRARLRATEGAAR